MKVQLKIYKTEHGFYYGKYKREGDWMFKPRVFWDSYYDSTRVFDTIEHLKKWLTDQLQHELKSQKKDKLVEVVTLDIQA